LSKKWDKSCTNYAIFRVDIIFVLSFSHFQNSHIFEHFAQKYAKISGEGFPDGQKEVNKHDTGTQGEQCANEYGRVRTTGACGTAVYRSRNESG
jgi:hypothetical protein